MREGFCRELEAKRVAVHGSESGDRCRLVLASSASLQSGHIDSSMGLPSMAEFFTRWDVCECRCCGLVEFGWVKNTNQISLLEIFGML